MTENIVTGLEIHKVKQSDVFIKHLKRDLTVQRFKDSVLDFVLVLCTYYFGFKVLRNTRYLLAIVIRMHIG